MTIPTTDVITFKCLTTSMRDKILELLSNDWYIESLDPTTDLKVKIVAKKLQAGMMSQSYTDIDMQTFWFRFANMRDFKIRQRKNMREPG